MNGNGQENRYSQATRPTQRSEVQRSAQRPIASGAYRTQPRPSMMSRVPMGFWILFATVLVALVLSLITMTVLLFTVEGEFNPSSNRDNDVVDKNDKDDDDDKGEDVTPANKLSYSPDLPYESTKTKRNNYALTVPNDAEQITGITSNYAVLVDLDSYKVIAEKSAAEKIYPASMTKIMTVLVGCEQVVKQGIDLSEFLTVKQEHVDYQKEMGASGNLGFVSGDQVTVENLLYLINYKSDTIACLLIAERVAGSEAAFVNMMNQKARSMGLSGTNFVNSTGLYDDNHYTTCADMAAIMAYVLDNPMANKVISAYKGRNIHIHKNDSLTPYRSPIAYSGWYSDRLEDNNKAGKEITIMGGKTGYETIPKCSFVTYAKHSSGKQYICVVVGDASASNNAQSTRTIYKNYAK